MSIGTPYKRFSADRTYDAIVIGSGIGGLTTAALLAKHAGQRVLVLERHYTAGGFTHAFTRPGFEWDVGVHYIGEVLEPWQRGRRLFDHLSEGRLVWADMGDVYDTIVVEGRRYDLPKGREALRAALVDYFPNEETAIDRYLAALKAAVRFADLHFAEKVIPRPLQRLIGGLLRWPSQRHARRTVADVLDGITDNPELRAVLAGQWGDYGLPPAQASFFMHALVVSHYLNGAAYPVGGAPRFAETILPVIEAAGGAVLVRAEVEEIVVQDGRAVGVRMADGKLLRARSVISAAGAALTYGRLLPKAVRDGIDVPPSLHEVPASGAHVSLYVGLDRSAEQLGLPRANRWLCPGPDHDANLARFDADPEAPLPVAYISFPSAKDPDYLRRHPDSATIEVIVPAPYAWFEKWQETGWGHRGDDYEALKARFTERMLEALVRECPSVQGHIVHAELSTPLSTRHFAGHPRGEIYGLAHTPTRFADRTLGPRTQVAGLYLAGSDVACAGVMGAAMGGVLAASALLRRNMMAVVMRGHDGKASAAEPASAASLHPETGKLT